MTDKGHGIGRRVMGCVAIPLLIIIAAVLIENPFRIKPGKGHREAEAQQNLHAIQLALERYAVDYGGAYPLWLSGGGFADPAAGDIDPHFVMDPLMAEGYMPQYPRNPFNRHGTGDTNDELRAMQIRLSDPFRPGSGSSVEPPVYRFGKDYELMGNVLADPGRGMISVGKDAAGNSLQQSTGTDVIYHCWDAAAQDKPQYWLQGQFFYQYVTAVGESARGCLTVARHPPMYVLGAFGKAGSEGKDVFGEARTISNRPETFHTCAAAMFDSASGSFQGCPHGLAYNDELEPRYKPGNPNGIPDQVLRILTNSPKVELDGNKLNWKTDDEREEINGN
ncbi:type II secretion system protein [bacterium]|nr:type II secretion system protein [bacterium]